MFDIIARGIDLLYLVALLVLIWNLCAFFWLCHKHDIVE